MIPNRSVPTESLLPHLTCWGVAAAIDWLTAAFRFVEHDRYGSSNEPVGAQVRVGNG